jgi:hypothetical protein
MKNLNSAVFMSIALTLLIACRENEMPVKETLLPGKAVQITSKSGLMMVAQGSIPVFTKLSGKGLVKLLKVEYMTSGKGGKAGQTIYFNDRGNKQLVEDFSPLLSLDGSTGISYNIESRRPSNDLPFSTSENAIERALKTWDNVKCSDLRLSKVSTNGNAKGLVPLLFGFEGSLDYVSDIYYGGWLDSDFFDTLIPGGGEYILAATFTLIFVDENGDFLDTDANRKADVAWREIYFNDGFSWNDGADFDVETIALHESGHGLSQDHFGKEFVSSNGKVHFAPRAVMNSAYSGIQREIGKTDLGGHCSIWASGL